MTIQIFYPEQNVTLNLAEALEWHFENEEYIDCPKEQADRLIVTFPAKMAKNSTLTLGGSPELYWSPYLTLSNGKRVPEGFVTEESWNKL